MLLVHDRIGVQGQPVPLDRNTIIDIPEEFYEDLVKIEKLSRDLTDARIELGRLMQVVNHLVYVCNSTEKGLADTKKNLIDTLGLSEGNWAIDFEHKQIGRVESTQKPMPHVV